MSKTEKKPAAKKAAPKKKAPVQRRKARLTPTQLDQMIASVKGHQKRGEALADRLKEAAGNYPEDSYIGKKLQGAAAEVGEGATQNGQVALEELEEIKARLEEFFL